MLKSFPHSPIRRAVLIPMLAGVTLALAPTLGTAAPLGLFDEATLQMARAIRDQAMADQTAWKLTDSLVSQVGPRLAGSRGDRAAVDWALKTLRELGFSNVRAEPVTVPHWGRGLIDLRPLGDSKPMTAVALGGSIGTSADGLVAPLVRVTSFEQLARLPSAAVKGHIVFFDIRMPRERDGSGYGKTVPVRYKAADAASRRGALAVVIRSVGTVSDERVAHTGMMHYSDEVPRIPAAAIALQDADRLASRLADEPDMQFRYMLGATNLPPARSANVIGEIPGETPEIVLLGAHLDSWDVAPGANDDGAGVGIVIAAAQLIARNRKPHRTLRVVLFANEEFGTSGAAQYALDHQDEMDRHVVAMEADFGSGAVWQLGADVDPAHWPVIQAMASLLEPLGVEPGSNGTASGSDVGPLRALGVPLISPRQDGTRYFDIHHTGADTMKYVDPQGLQQNVATYAVAAWLVSQYGPGLGRMPIRQGGDEH